MMDLLIWIGTVVVAVLAWIKSSDAFWQYLFLLRVPLLLGFLLVALPLIATQWLKAMLRNLFVLRGRWQISFTIISAIMAGLAVVLVANIVLINASDRFGVAQWIKIPDTWQYILAIVLGLPVCIAVIVLSQEQSVPVFEQDVKISDADRWIGGITGAIASLGLLFLVDQIRDWLFSQTALKQVFIQVISFLSKGATAGYVSPGNPGEADLTRGHLTALAFFVVELVIYLFVAYRFQPKPKSGRKEVPALVYMLVLLTAATLFLGGMTFFFDYYRVLPLLLLLLGSIASYSLFKVDHFFALRSRQQSLQNPPSSPVTEDFKVALTNRLQHQGANKTLVVICASGGGIQAAGWTAQVLMGLQAVVGNDFAKAIGLISSVSGGSVGSLYYLDRIDLPNHIPTPGDQTIFRSATRDSLDAVGWGLAYPDLWRVIGLPFLAPKLCDRGTAIETDWQGEMKTPRATTWISNWRTQALNGEIPIPVFNATIVDTGDRFLISPLSFYDLITTARQANPQNPCETQDFKFYDFNKLYEKYDMSVVTAARLSASFPYVSPVARPCIMQNDQPRGFPDAGNYHFADGGYFDNSGAFTAAEWLNCLLSSEQNPGIKRVMIVQINPFPQDDVAVQPAASKNQGWIMGVVGPLLALFKVRNSTQIARTEAELALLQQRWDNDPQDVTIKTYSVFFPSFAEMKQLEPPLQQQAAKPLKRQDESTFFFDSDGRYVPPLSWKLTDAEKKAIQDGWDLIANDSKGEIQCIKAQWDEWQQNPS